MAAPPALIRRPSGFVDELQLEEQAQLKNSGIFSAIVKVFSTSTPPSFSMPWQKLRQTTSTASGFIISGRRVLTNAHAVEFCSSVRLRKHGDSRKYTASVVHIGHECDLAVLTVDDDTFFEHVQPLEFGSVPPLQSAVVCVGYATGGSGLSVSKGVVSRVDVIEYAHSSVAHLVVQIDAAINSGNSGGPALLDGSVVGVAFESLIEGENIGYIIPVPVIQHFLTDIERNSKYTGFPVVGVIWQALDSAASLRDYLRMAPEQQGVLVNKVQPLAPASQLLKPFDVLLAINGTEIADDGTIAYRDDQRIAFRHVCSQLFPGDECEVRILRDGEEQTLKVRVENRDPLVPITLFETPPSYYVWAGLVFTVLSRPFLYHEYGSQWPKKAPIRLCELAFYALKEVEDQEVIVLNQILVSDINVGYQTLTNLQVRAVNGVKIRNLHHLVHLFETTEEEYMRVDLDMDKVVIIEKKAGDEASPMILVNNNISVDRSEDVSTPFPGLKDAPSDTD